MGRAVVDNLAVLVLGDFGSLEKRRTTLGSFANRENGLPDLLGVPRYEVIGVALCQPEMMVRKQKQANGLVVGAFPTGVWVGEG